jgi:ABC-2 type transport system permease protein
MKSVVAIAKRETWSFFVSPIAYFVLSGFFIIAAYFFFNLLGQYNFYLQRASMMPMGGPRPNLNEWVVEVLFQTIVVVLVFLVPFLTMRMLSEEKRTGTFELLITSPLSVNDIVVGKFLGVLVIVGLMVGAISAFPLLLVYYGTPGPVIGPIITGLIGLFLCAASFVSLGMAVSCFTVNQVVAGITGMVVLLLLYMIQTAGQSIGGEAERILSYLSPIEHLKGFFKGVISLKGIFYFFSVIWVGLFFSQRALESYRWR